jgi:acetylornithine deacetylase
MKNNEVINLLQQLITIPSISKEEDKTADVIEAFLKGKGIEVNRHLNNVWARNKFFDAAKPTILLNSHHDTVKPNQGYTKDPFKAIIEDGKLYGLGSNDAGGALVSLLATFLHFYDKPLVNNLIFSATAEEEISGSNGIEAMLPLLGKIDFAVVGEPTQMQLAIAEKGLIVLDCVAHGKSGHAAREEGINAIYQAMPDIEWFTKYSFPKVSKLLGHVKMSVTAMHSGSQHNIVPDTCEFTVDVRVNECYSNEEVLDIISKNVKCDVKARSLRLQPSFISEEHPIVKAGKALGLKVYGSPTLSDRALMPFPSLKAGPGDSARSHIADEFIYLKEIEDGIDLYINMLNKILIA